MRKKTSMILFCTAFLSIVLLLGPTQANAKPHQDKPGGKHNHFGEPPPLPLETSCKDIVSTNPPACVTVCFKPNGELDSAELFNGVSPVCGAPGEGTPLEVRNPGEDESDPNMVLCTPCAEAELAPPEPDVGIDVVVATTVDPTCPSGDENGDVPFTEWIGDTPYKCDYFLYTQEDMSVATESDPCYRTRRGSYVCW